MEEDFSTSPLFGIFQLKRLISRTQTFELIEQKTPSIEPLCI